ncbi:flagellin N-terminal helical domain-containing protein [Mesoterricola sediminis]|uniref:Flagellin n=1 Tax=Mesoterricola sediminis TaxID=2927980 RepID=A0AA48KCI8_9BACT|nr:flagellin [Mesoterricola sediminis]BDU77194.1 flagellar hook-associated protein 3 [Mesoterricola sediminis]
MTIRSTNPMNSAQLLLDLQRSKDRLSLYTSQLTSGKRIINIGDDPGGSAAILNFQASIGQNKQYMAQIDTATSYLANTEDVASSMQTEVTRLMQLAQTGMTGTQSSVSRQAIASEVDGIFDHLMNLANTQVQGKYIFAGSMTTGYTDPLGVFHPPFEDVQGATAPANTITYNGNNADIVFKVGASSNVTTNVAGDTLFFGGPAATSLGSATDIFKVAKDLSQALTSGNTAAMQTAYDSLKTISDHVNVVITDLGGRQSGIDQIKTSLSTLNTNLAAVESSVEDVDYADAITSYTKENVAQQASLATMAKTNRQTLFDYLA